MKKVLGHNTTASKVDNELIIKVTGTLPEKWMEHAIFIWLLLWSSLGAVVIYYFVSDQFTTDQKGFFLAYLFFWAYFEWKSLHSYLYKKFGYELIRIKDGHLYYRKYLFGMGQPKRYDLRNIEELGVIEHSRKSFAAAYGKSFWVIGNERVGFVHLSKKVAMGMQITDQEAKGIVKLIRQMPK